MYRACVKRLLDVVFSFFAFLLLSPLFLICAVAIKVFDPGPVIFCQRRVGKNGVVFDFYKFRSMPVNTGDIPSDQIGKIEITWFGKFIRRTNIDELPQLLNILLGDMSIVGPRPSLPSQLELVEARRLSGALMCRPGLTGLAQVNSFDGMSISEKARFDAEYAQSLSLWLDVKIILATFLYLLKPPPKY